MVVESVPREVFVWFSSQCERVDDGAEGGAADAFGGVISFFVGELGVKTRKWKKEKGKKRKKNIQNSRCKHCPDGDFAPKREMKTPDFNNRAEENG